MVLFFCLMASMFMPLYSMQRDRETGQVRSTRPDLYTAILEDDPEKISRLITSDSDVNKYWLESRYSSGWHPLEYAHSYDKFEAFKALLGNGADAKKCYKWGNLLHQIMSPLHHFDKKTNKVCFKKIKLLIKKDASLAVYNIENALSPLDEERITKFKEKFPETFKELQFIIINNASLTRVTNDDLKEIKNLFLLSSFIEQKDDSGNTILA